MAISLGFAAQAQGYPTKPVRLVVSFAAGGTSDILARILAPKLSEALGQTVLVDNRPGAGGNIGAEVVAKAAPDGYTLLLAPPSLTANLALYGKLSFDPVQDLAPVTLIAELPIVLVVHPALPAKSVQELIALAKAQPGKLNFGSSGNGGIGHLVGEMFKSMTGVQMVHVPYKGNGPALTDLMAGVLNLTFSDIAGALPHVKSGKLRTLAIASQKRSPTLPDVPTIIEAGVAGFQASSWFGIVVTAGTPQPVIAKLNQEFTKLLRTPETRERLTGLAFDVVGSTTAEFAAFLRNEFVKWTRVVKDSGAKIN